MLGRFVLSTLGAWGWARRLQRTWTQRPQSYCLLDSRYEDEESPGSIGRERPEEDSKIGTLVAYLLPQQTSVKGPPELHYL